MAGVYKRASDKTRGKSGKWTAWWLDDKGKKRSRAAFTDKGKSLEYAHDRERDARLVREGIIDPKDRDRREAALRPIGGHVDDYLITLSSKGNTVKHCDDVRSTLTSFMREAGIPTLGGFDPFKVQTALGRLRETRSARTCNKTLGFVKAFVTWLYGADRIKDVPRGLASIKPLNEAEDKRYERRSLTMAEIESLFSAAESGPPFESTRGPRKGPRVVVWITGPERACLYRLAMGTGFRAEELRTLTPERFKLDGDEPTVTVLACYAKNGKEAVQPITPELAAGLRPFVEGKPPGVPIIPIPMKTAHMLRRDLSTAGIEVKTTAGLVDFHALRHSYITHLVNTGANIKIVQTLARHSTPTLTLGRYAHVEDGDLRKALGRTR